MDNIQFNYLSIGSITHWMNLVILEKLPENGVNAFVPESELISRPNLAFSVRFYLQTMNCGLFNEQHHSVAIYSLI